MVFQDWIQVNFKYDKYQMTWGKFTKQGRATLEAAIPKGYRVVGHTYSQSSASQYYWVISGDRCFSVRISNHYQKKGLPAKLQWSFVTSHFESFLTMQYAITQFLTQARKYIQLEFQDFLLLAFIQQAQRKHTIFFKDDALIICEPGKHHGTKIHLSLKFCRKFRTLIIMDLLVNGDDPHYYQWAGVSLTQGGIGVLAQYRWVMTDWRPDLVPLPILEMDYKPLKHLLGDLTAFTRELRITSLQQYSLFIQFITRLEKPVYFDDYYLEYQDQSFVHELHDDNLIKWINEMLDLKILEWHQDSTLSVTAYGRYFLDAVQHQYQLLVNYALVPKFPMELNELATAEMMAALTNTVALRKLNNRYRRVGLEKLHQQFYQVKATNAQICANYFRQQRIMRYDGTPEILGELIAILYNRYDDNDLLKKDTKGNVIWNGYQVYGRAIMRALVRTKAGQQLFEPILRPAKWRKDRRKVLSVRLKNNG
ncbi:hypothetical protein [Loigolactobacillus bifermentans]|nr:hypothetical protein [Loigolactobacillus bifermentans]